MNHDEGPHVGERSGKPWIRWLVYLLAVAGAVAVALGWYSLSGT